MDVLDQLAARLVSNSQEAIQHDHCNKIEMRVSALPLPCGSEYFITFNDGFTLGFSRDEFIEFKESICEGVNAAVNQTTENASREAEVKPCLLCGKNIEAGLGFDTTLGAMHFECSEG